jgi:hypothetical protein
LRRSGPMRRFGGRNAVHKPSILLYFRFICFKDGGMGIAIYAQNSYRFSPKCRKTFTWQLVTSGPVTPVHLTVARPTRRWPSQQALTEQMVTSALGLNDREERIDSNDIPVRFLLLCTVPSRFESYRFSIPESIPNPKRLHDSMPL